MSTDRSHEIQEMVDRESRAYDTADTALMMTIYHPDMVWAWPPNAHAHDPMEWVLRLGRFNYERWYRLSELFFETHRVIHNHRITRKIVMSAEQDGGFAVVDIDTLFEQRKDRSSPWHEGAGQLHVKGRACKIYTTVGDEWKLLYQPGTMHYPIAE